LWLLKKEAPFITLEWQARGKSEIKGPNCERKAESKFDIFVSDQQDAQNMRKIAQRAPILGRSLI